MVVHEDGLSRFRPSFSRGSCGGDSMSTAIWVQSAKRSVTKRSHLPLRREGDCMEVLDIERATAGKPWVTAHRGR